jgi:uncharacterized protein (TIGR02001 family)
MSKFTKIAAAIALVSGSVAVPSVAMADFTANAAMGSNYVWRGLTQTENEAAISGGIDYASESGFYVGTWASNVNYGAGDEFSFEHDVYGGYAWESGDMSFDVGYLYYNYDKDGKFDFGEIYGSVGIGAFSATLSVLANTEADEAPGQDFGFGEATYLSLDYAIPVGENGTEMAFHIGRHAGDFVEAFNGVPDTYIDYGVTFSNGGFAFMISGTDTDEPEGSAYNNDELRFTVSYGLDFDL